MRTLISTFLLLLVAAWTADGETTNRLHFASSGFSIAPLDAPVGPTARQSVMMFLPVSGGFAANVNVQIQPYDGSIEDYLKLSVKQFETMGLNLIRKTKQPGEALVFEYAGAMQSKQLHWYAKAVKAKDHVYLVTATASEVQWPEVSAQLRECVDSFSVDGAEKKASKG